MTFPKEMDAKKVSKGENLGLSKYETHVPCRGWVCLN
ncbi:Uncharacterised protein [Serratia marcescens]|nr:Uncharacterised protein [Serratia marcescens]CAI1794574.1 Uncharacterised protein [Serratia marcescens]CVD88401.1 Uncharacterised protein [Serratia marcescens]CVE67279.1 Uncharacterised protein [Serratia marcescens]